MTLTDSQLVLLSAAAQRDDRLLTPPTALKGGVLHKLTATLLKQELVQEVAVTADQPHWSVDAEGSRRGLAITDAGLITLGITPEAETSANHICEAGAPTTGDALLNAMPGESLATMAKSNGVSATARAGSKAALVLALLTRPEGTSLDQLVAATGWLPHTTRAALTGLRKKGHELTKSKGEDGKTIYRIATGAEAA